MAAMDASTTTITTPMSADEVRAAIGGVLNSYGATPAGGDDTTIEAKSGKKVGTRLLGAIFVPEDWLPLHYTVNLAESPGETRVDITVHDDFGIGLRSGFKTKYEHLMKRRLSELTAALR